MGTGLVAPPILKSMIFMQCIKTPAKTWSFFCVKKQKKHLFGVDL
jgi:hypothetical protein